MLKYSLQLNFQLNWMETAEEIDDLFLGDAEVSLQDIIQCPCTVTISLSICQIFYFLFNLF